MATTVKTTKYFYPPRPGSGAGTFSDNIVGLQLVDGGGLTQGNFEFTTGVVEKVNRTFGIGAFAAPVSLSDLGIKNVAQSNRTSTQFRVYPNYDISQVQNFSLYGSLAKRFSVSVTKIINYFPASIDVLFNNLDFSTGNTAVNISYDLINDETYFEVDVDRIHNPFGIDYTISAATNLARVDNEVSPYRNLYNTYLDYAILVNGGEYKVNSFLPSDSLSTGYIAFYVSGTPFGTNTTTSSSNFLIRPNDYIVDKVFAENFDEIEQYLLNRLVQPIYTATFQVPEQNNYGQFYSSQQQVTWPVDGQWNLDIRSTIFDVYLTQLQQIAGDFDEFKTNLLSRFLTSGSLKEFDTMGRKVEKVFQIYGRSFDQLKQYIDGLSFANSVNYNPENDIPSELLSDLAHTLGWGANFSPIVDDNYLGSIFGNQVKPTYPGYARAQTATELNYAFYRNLILNSAYIFKSKGTRRSIEFLLNLIGAPESIVEFNEHVYVADRKVDIDSFNKKYSNISGGTAVDEVPAYEPGNTFNFYGLTFTAFTTNPVYTNVTTTRNDYPIDDEGYPKSPTNSDNMFFQKGAGWYEQTPQHTSPDELIMTDKVFTGQNTNIQTQLTPFTYGDEYLNFFRKFQHINEGYNLTRVVDNNKSWLNLEGDVIRNANNANYNAYYYVEDEKLIMNVKNVDLFLNPGQGLVYDVWFQSRNYDYPIPESGLTEYYPVPGGVDSTFIDPNPKQKTFFEFAQTFWQNMINVRNRLFITDGKTGGYPTLQSIWWKYIQQYQNIGIQNNQYTYQKLIDYANGMGPYWMKLVEQMIPATTIWQSGTRFENSVLQRQKFVYRRNRGCIVTEESLPASQPSQERISTNAAAISPIITVDAMTNNANNEYVEIYVFPWLNGSSSVSSFSDILYGKINNTLKSVGQTIATCPGANSVTSNWYVDLRIGDEILIQENFYNGFGISDVPSNSDWEIALFNFLPSIVNFGLTYFLYDNKLKVINLGNQPLYLNQKLTLNVGINIELTC
jgi:hypothetical protein